MTPPATHPGVVVCKPGNVVALVKRGMGLHSSTFQLYLSRFGHTFPCPPV